VSDFEVGVVQPGSTNDVYGTTRDKDSEVEKIDTAPLRRIIEWDYRVSIVCGTTISSDPEKLSIQLGHLSTLLEILQLEKPTCIADDIHRLKLQLTDSVAHLRQPSLDSSRPEWLELNEIDDTLSALDSFKELLDDLRMRQTRFAGKLRPSGTTLSEVLALDYNVSPSELERLYVYYSSISISTWTSDQAVMEARSLLQKAYSDWRTLTQRHHRESETAANNAPLDPQVAQAMQRRAAEVSSMIEYIFEMEELRTCKPSQKLNPFYILGLDPSKCDVDTLYARRAKMLSIVHPDKCRDMDNRQNATYATRLVIDASDHALDIIKGNYTHGYWASPKLPPGCN